MNEEAKKLISQAVELGKNVEKMAVYLDPEDLRTLENILKTASEIAGNQAHYYENN